MTFTRLAETTCEFLDILRSYRACSGCFWRRLNMADSPQDRVRLDLGTGTRVSIPVTERSPHSVTLSQPLPFLRLHHQIEDDEGRYATLVGVSVVVRDDTPHLVLDLTYPEMSASMTASPGCLAPFPPPEASPPAGPSDPRPVASASRSQTSPYAVRPARRSPSIPVGGDAPAESVPNAAAQRVAALRGPRPSVSRPAHVGSARQRFVRPSPGGTPALGPLRRSPWQRAWAWICF